jgi:anti-anti-sigma factor
MVVELEIERRMERGVAILVLKGRLNVHTYEKLETALNELFSAGCYRLIIDMGKVEYMSSAGAGALMNAFSQCFQNQGRMVLANVSHSVLDVLDVLNLVSFLPTTLSLESALAGFPAGGESPQAAPVK